MNRTIREVFAFKLAAIGVLAAGVVWAGWRANFSGATVQPARFAGPTSSQSLALTADDLLLVVANLDNDSVTFFDVGGDENRRLAEV
ncbi:MAG TPA: hypothetical protein VNM72_14665 [Blastocatellia bacterium]|nr:hypothetical protein [Blastocatellia bacterium]